MGAEKRRTSPLRRRFSRRFQVSLVVEGTLVGVVGGTVVTLYRLALSAAEGALGSVIALARENPAVIAAWLVALACVLLVVSRLVAWEPMTSGSGIPQVEAEVAGRLDAPWARVVPAKFAEGTLLTLAGLSLGREGPSVQIGGMSGKAVSRALRRERGEERLLVTCGAAAGMSAAFHAPFTGVLFALEEIHRQFSAALIITVMCSAVVADLIASQVIGLTPVLALAFSHDLPHASYVLVAALGLVCGLLGAAHNRGMFAAQGLLSRLGTRHPEARLAVPLALAALAAFLWPELTCGGERIVELLLSGGGLTVGGLLALLAGKYALTAVSFGSGAPGGTLYPLVVMGALVGAIFSLAAGPLAGLGGDYFLNFVALGVAGLFSGVVRAPVTAVVLVFELTGSFDALLSAALVSVLAYVTSSLTETDAFYEHLLEPLLAAAPGGAESGASPRKDLGSVRVGAGSRLEGRLVSEVPWPDGARLVTIERAGRELIPTGDTRLCALDELTFIAGAAETDDARLKLTLMCEPRSDARSDASTDAS